MYRQRRFLNKAIQPREEANKLDAWFSLHCSHGKLNEQGWSSKQNILCQYLSYYCTKQAQDERPTDCIHIKMRKGTKSHIDKLCSRRRSFRKIAALKLFIVDLTRLLVQKYIRIIRYPGRSVVGNDRLDNEDSDPWWKENKHRRTK